jgi:hypothetical protein
MHCSTIVWGKRMPALALMLNLFCRYNLTCFQQMTLILILKTCRSISNITAARIHAMTPHLPALAIEYTVTPCRKGECHLATCRWN